MGFVQPGTDEVFVAVLRVGINDGIRLAVAIQGIQHGVHHIGLADPEQCGLLAVHGDVHLRVIFLPADLDVGEPRRLVHDRVNLADERAGLFEFVPVDFHINRGLRPKAHDALHDAARIEDHQHTRKELLHVRAHLVHDLHLIACPFIGRHEIHLDERGVRARIGVE